MTITPEQAADIEKRLAAFDAWLGKRRSYPVGSAPAGMEVSNEDRTALELFKFKRDKPTRYTAYASESDNSVTTWTGDVGDALDKAAKKAGGRDAYAGDDGKLYLSPA